MTQHELDALLARNPALSLGSAWKAAVMECREQNALEGAPCSDKQDTARFFVRVQSVRKRLLDEDRICEVAVVDCLRYSGIISADSPDTTHIETTQRKAAKGEAEKTIVEVFAL